MTPRESTQTLEPTIEVEQPRDTCGLGGLLALVAGKEQALPLEDVKVRAAIAGDRCRSVVEQRFYNHLEKPLEAVHIFPLPEDGAIVEMELRAGDKVVRADLRPREEAEKAFEEARLAGHRAGLLTQERPDVHTLRVTNLPPKTEVTVRMVLVERLECIDGLLRWRFPTAIPPRYILGMLQGHAGAGTTPDTDQVPDASHLTPPLRLEGGTRLDLEVSIQGPVRALESSLHAVRLDLSDGRTVRVAPSAQATLDRDFVLAFSTADEAKASVRAWTDGAYSLVTVEPPMAEPSEILPRDVVFVIDISGSMGGSKLEAARRALRTALHGLQTGDRFKLVAFESRLHLFADGFTDFDQKGLERADAWIADLHPMGGTEMLPAVQEALRHPPEAGRAGTVLFITDGQVGNTNPLLAAVKNRSAAFRFFTMGIDTAVNADLLKRMASLGGGTCELLTPQADIEAAVARLEVRFGSPLAQDVHIEGGELADDRPLVLFAGRPLSRMLKGVPKMVNVLGKTAEGRLELQTSPEKVDFPLGALWGRERIAFLEDRLATSPWEEEAIRGEIIRIGMEHGIASRFTAFVAVDTSVNEKGERVEIVQPVELPLGWDEAFLSQAKAFWGQPQFDRFGSPGAFYSLERHATRGSLGSRGYQGKQPMAAPLPSWLESLSPAPGPRAEAPARGGGELARIQDADGSFGGDAARTAAALIALILLGHTRRKGLRTRTVSKAAKWLEQHAGTRDADLALEVLKRAEAGEPPQSIWSGLEKGITELFSAGKEGECLEVATKGWKTSPS
jgi:Ca-activated chloride channel family protein